jgi:hypothetical protein
MLRGISDITMLNGTRIRGAKPRDRAFILPSDGSGDLACLTADGVSAFANWRQTLDAQVRARMGSLSRRLAGEESHAATSVNGA